MKPQGHVLQVLDADAAQILCDGDYYHHDNGSVDLTRVDGPLRTAAQVALFENLKVYENGRQLPFRISSWCAWRWIPIALSPPMARRWRK